MSGIPVWEKSNLMVDEAAEYFSIGEDELAEIMAEDGCKPSLLPIGDRKLIKRRQFEDYLSTRYSVGTCESDESVVQSAAQAP